MNKAFLYEMLRTESVSGGEIPLQKKVAAYMRSRERRWRPIWRGM